jgi:hypothetical protein
MYRSLWLVKARVFCMILTVEKTSQSPVRGRKATNCSAYDGAWLRERPFRQEDQFWRVHAWRVRGQLRSYHRRSRYTTTLADLPVVQCFLITPWLADVYGQQKTWLFWPFQRQAFSTDICGLSTYKKGPLILEAVRQIKAVQYTTSVNNLKNVISH